MGALPPMSFSGGHASGQSDGSLSNPFYGGGITNGGNSGLYVMGGLLLVALVLWKK